ncbi:hypothetical protein KAH81_06425 [bacterium]|nr:hypothetical protein [bacterium]
MAIIVLIAISGNAQQAFRLDGMKLNQSGVARIFEMMSPYEFTADLQCRLDTAAVDIVFCMDSSRSMDPYIDDLHDEMSYFITELESRGYDYRLGGVPFDDSTNVWDFDPYTPGNQMTADDSVFIAQLDVTGGSLVSSDLNEVSLDAICDAVRLYEWREDALRIIIMFTNEGYHYLGDGSSWSDETVDGTRSLVFSTGTVVFIAASSRPWPSTPIHTTHLTNYQNLARDSGGNWYNLSTTWDVIFDDVVALIGTFMSVSADVTNVTGGACTISTEIFPLESSCIMLLSTNPVVSSSPVPSSDSYHVFWKVILDSACVGTDECFYIQMSGSGFVDSAYGCIVDDSCFGHTDLSASPSSSFITPGCTDIYPNPITITVVVTNEGTRPATSVAIQFNPIDSGLTYIGGDPNPSSVSEILYDGGFTEVNWQVSIDPSVYGRVRSYEVVVYHDEGDVVRDTVHISIPSLLEDPILAVYADDPIICYGASTMLHSSITPVGSWSYSWSPTTGLSDPSAANPIATPSRRTTYILTVNDSIDCSAYDSVFVNIAPVIYPNAGEDTTIFSGESVILGGSPTATGGYGLLDYSWSPTTWLSDPFVPNPVAEPPESVTYVLTVTDSVGCFMLDSVRVNIVSSAMAIIFVKTDMEILHLRVIDTLSAISAGNGVIMVALPDGTIGAADLVDTTETHASPVNVRTIYGIRSWRKAWY